MPIFGRQVNKTTAILVRKTQVSTTPSHRSVGLQQLTRLEDELQAVILQAFDNVPDRAYLTVLDDKEGLQYRDTVYTALMKEQPKIEDILLRQIIATGSAEAIDLSKMLAEQFKYLFGKADALTPTQVAQSFRFDLNSQDALNFARTESGQLITNMADEQRAVMRQVVGQSMTAGATRAGTSSALRTVLQDIATGTEYGRITATQIGANCNGLTRQYEKAVWNRANDIAEDLARRGIEGTKAVEEIRKKTDAYAEKLRKARARTIARTEIIRSAEEGRQQAWEQASKKGLIDKNKATKTWSASPMDVCPICSKLQGKTVPLMGKFSTGISEVKTPPAHPNCRCTMRLNTAKEPPKTIGTGTQADPFRLEVDAGPPNIDDFPPLPGSGSVTPPASPVTPTPPATPRTPRAPKKPVVQTPRVVEPPAQPLPTVQPPATTTVSAPKPAPQPTRTPVSLPNTRTVTDSLEFPEYKKGELLTRTNAYKKTAGYIDEIHVMPDDSINRTVVTLKGKTQQLGGTFDPNSKGVPYPKRIRGQSQEEYLARLEAYRVTPRKPEITLNLRGDEGIGGSQFSFAHELGHRLDMIPDELLTPNSGRYYSTRAANRVRIGGEKLDEIDEAMLRFLEEAKGTESLKRLVSSVSTSDYGRYVQSTHEVWARAYSQMIAIESGDVGMLAQAARLAKTGYQFSDDEMEVLIPLIKDVLRKRGLLIETVEDVVTPQVIDIVLAPVAQPVVAPAVQPVVLKPLPKINKATKTLEDFEAEAEGLLNRFVTDGGGYDWDLKTNNIGTRVLWQEQGFDALPQVLDDAQFSTLETRGWTRVFRGINGDSAQEVNAHVAQFIEGAEPFAGQGLFGTGHYSTTIRESAEAFSKTAMGVGQQQGARNAGQVIEMMISPDAKIIDIEDLQRMYSEQLKTWRAQSRAIFGERANGLEARTFDQLSDSEKDIVRRLASMENIIQDDPGRYATMMGYDAIRIKTPQISYTSPDKLPDTYYAILNRGAVAVKRITPLAKALKQAKISFAVKKAWR